MAVVVLVLVGVVLGVLAVGAKHIRRRGGAGPAISAAMAAYDEATHSTAHDTFVEMQAQKDRSVAAPAPGSKK